MTITEESCFYPDAFDYYHPLEAGFETIDISIEDRLWGWLIKPKYPAEKISTIIHLHGNAQNMSSHVLGSLFLAEGGFNLVTFDYSGYGHSKGQPTLEGIQNDAIAVFKHVFSSPEIFGEAVFGFGQSMGGFTLGRILPDIQDLRGAIFDCALHSFRALFLEGYPMHECSVPEISSLETLPKSKVPKLFIHGTADDVVPYHHSEEMFKAAAKPKTLYLVEGADHIAALATKHADEYKSRILSFIESNRD